MSISDTIQIVGILVTLVTSVIAILISVFSLRQNSKMIEESSRGYISIYFGATNWSGINNYIVIKNFGNSSATITDFKSDFDFSEISYAKNLAPFVNINGTTLAPNESIKYAVNLNYHSRPKNLKQIDIEYTYVTLNKTHKEKISLNIAAQCSVVYYRNNPNNELNGIAHALQDISEKML